MPGVEPPGAASGFCAAGTPLRHWAKMPLQMMSTSIKLMLVNAFRRDG
jgi:hypothetical protein